MPAGKPENQNHNLDQGIFMLHSRLLLVTLALSVLGLSGCATNPMRSYDDELKQTAASIASNNIPKALAEHEKNSSTEKDLLYFLEKGKLLRLNQQIPESRDTWLQADEKVRLWEEEVKLNPDKILSYLGSAIVNDKMIRYDGQDFEKVMLSTNLALNHVLLGDWDKARTEIKKMHEREAIIADLRAKEMEKVEEEAKKREVKTEIKDLKGYPVETLDDPEVTKLKNSYQSAFGHYLAGFVYEALNEPSLAAPGYRKAIELRPGIKILEDGLSYLDKRTGTRMGKANLTDVLFVVESGMAPARESITIPLPIPTGSSIVVSPISFPIVKTSKAAPPAFLTLDGNARLGLSSITSLDIMAKRALRDDMPGIILRTTIRAITKGVAQDQMQKKGGALLGVVAAVAAVVTESADERAWRTLPADISIARVQLPAGKHVVEIAGNKREIEVGGRYAIIPLRVVGNTLYFSQPVLQPVAAQPEVSPEPSATELKPAAPAAVAPEVRKARPAKKQKTPPKKKPASTASKPVPTVK
jgi:hypothetical protein